MMTATEYVPQQLAPGFILETEDCIVAVLFGLVATGGKVDSHAYGINLKAMRTGL